MPFSQGFSRTELSNTQSAKVTRDNELTSQEVFQARPRHRSVPERTTNTIFPSGASVLTAFVSIEARIRRSWRCSETLEHGATLSGGVESGHDNRVSTHHCLRTTQPQDVEICRVSPNSYGTFSLSGTGTVTSAILAEQLASATLRPLQLGLVPTAANSEIISFKLGDEDGFAQKIYPETQRFFETLISTGCYTWYIYHGRFTLQREAT